MEKVRNRLKKSVIWTEAGGVNYTLTATEMIGQAVMKLQNKTLLITTTLVIRKLMLLSVNLTLLFRMTRML